MRRKLTLFLLLVVGACVEPLGPEYCVEIETCAFAPELEIDLSQMTRTASGLYWQDTDAGHGTPASAGTFVFFHSTAWLSNGTLINDTHVIDPSCNCVRAMADTVGVGRMIPGWDEGLIGVQLGAVRRMVIPATLAYGEAGSGTVPPNAVLVSEIEVLALSVPE